MKIFTSIRYALFVMAVFFVNISAHAQAPPVNPNIRMADSLFMAGSGEWKKMKTLYESASPAELSAANWSRMGFANYHVGNYSEAMKDYQQVLVKNPVPLLRAMTYSRIAKVYALQNDKPNAMTALDSAIHNGYANLSEMDTLSDYNSIRNEPNFQTYKKAVYARAFPCMVNAQAREFDFWIGEWMVYVTGTKTYAGHSVIQMISSGCALLENWDSPGGNGKSINYIDPSNTKWKQAWVGSGLMPVQEFVNGEYKDGAMRFTFDAVTLQGQKVMGRFIFYNEKPGQVRQFNETSADGGKTWITTYDFTYFKKG